MIPLFSGSLLTVLDIANAAIAGALYPETVRSIFESVEILFTKEDVLEGGKPWYSAAQWSVVYSVERVTREGECGGLRGTLAVAIPFTSLILKGAPESFAFHGLDDAQCRGGQ